MRIASYGSGRGEIDKMDLTVKSDVPAKHGRSTVYKSCLRVSMVHEDSHKLHGLQELFEGLNGPWR